MRLSAPALVLTGLFFAACSGSVKSGNDAGPTVCTTPASCATIDPVHCGAGKECVCYNKACVFICQANSDCTGNQICVLGSCSNPGCGGNADCTGGQVCIGGACASPTAATDVHSCVVTPGNAAVRTGSTIQLSAVAQDASGNALPFTGVAWSVGTSDPATIDASTGLLTGVAATANGSQSATVTAKIGTAVSCTAAVKVYGTFSTTNSLRVVVIDEDTKVPVQGAFIALDANTAAAQTTGADGSTVFTLTGAATAHNVHAFAANHDYASYIGVTGADLLIPLRQFYPIAQRAEFDGTITEADFNILTAQQPPPNTGGYPLHLGFFGTSIAGSVLDFSLDNFIGKTRPVTISLANATVNLPGGLILGLGSDLYSTGAYSMYADPGQRILWGIGGNLDPSVVIPLATSLTGGTSNINIGALLPQVLPLLASLEIGEHVGVTTGPSGPTPTPIAQTVTLDTPMHMKVGIKAPTLPMFEGKYLDGVVALSGAAAFPMGFTPLGVTAGLAATDSSGAQTGKICSTPDSDGGTNDCSTADLPLAMAPRNHGLESYPFGVGLVALNFSSLASAFGSGSTGTATIAISGIMKTMDNIAFAGGTAAPTEIDMTGTPFMSLATSTANTVTYSKASRTVHIPADADASTQIYKFTLQNSTHQTWSIYMPPAGQSGSTAVLVDPTAISSSLSDLQHDATASGWVAAIATTSTSNTFASLTGFGNVTVDALGNSLKAFAVQTVTLGQ